MEMMHAIQNLRRVESNQPIVSYAHIGFPDSVWGPRSVACGGSLKYRYLDKTFSHAGLTCNILYIINNGRPPAVLSLLRKARYLGIHVVWNQNGALFPSAFGQDVARKGNAAMARQMRYASYVFYQGHFAKKGSDHFLGACACPFEVLHNAVDTAFFTPSETIKHPDMLTLLVCGSHNDYYRLPLAFDVFENLLKRNLSVHLKIAGRMSHEAERMLKERVERSNMWHLVQFLGEYSQDQAPGVYHSADMLLHTQYNDVCPSVVLEAMACGLPVVYSKTGGTPEMVGEEAGCGVPSELNWDVAQPPDASALADAAVSLKARLTESSRAARRRVVENFDLANWLRRHEIVFQGLLERQFD